MVELFEGSLLPRVENPIPEAIGLDVIFTLAGAGGMVLRFASSALGLPEGQRDAWARTGMNLGVLFGVCLYLVALVAQLL